MEQNYLPTLTFQGNLELKKPKEPSKHLLGQLLGVSPTMGDIHSKQLWRREATLWKAGGVWQPCDVSVSIQHLVTHHPSCVSFTNGMMIPHRNLEVNVLHIKRKRQ